MESTNPNGGELTLLLQRIDAQMGDLLLMKEAVELNQQETHITMRRLKLQQTLLKKMLAEMQTLVANLHVAIGQHGPQKPMH